MRYRIEQWDYLPEYFNFFSKGLLIIFVATLLVIDVHAQNRKLDSLEGVLADKEGIDRFETLINKVRTTLYTDFNAAYAAANEAYEIALNEGDTLRIVEGGRILGQVLARQEKRLESIKVLEKVLPVAERHQMTTDIKLILMNLGNAYTFVGNYDKALAVHFRVLGLTEEHDDIENKGFTYNNLGLLFSKMKNFKEAKSYYEKALKIQLQTDRYDIGILLNNIGDCHNALGEYALALERFKQALNECVDECAPSIALNANLGSGIAFLNLEKYDLAEKHVRIALSRSGEVANRRFESEGHYWLGRIYKQRNDYDAAIDEFEKAEMIAEKGEFRESLMHASQALADVYHTRKDFDKYSRYVNQYIALKDDMYDEDVMQTLARSRAEYEQRMNMATIEANKTTIAQQKRLYMSALVIAIMAIVIVIGLVVAYRALKRVNHKLSQAQDVIHEQNRKLGVRNAELDRLVEKKTEELRHVNLALKQMNDELDTFVLKSAEDIRAPLASLMGICHVAMLDIKDNTSLMYVKMISKTTEVLNSILKRLLALNKINHAKPSLSETDLPELVDQVLSLQMKKGIPEKVVVRKNIVKNTSLLTDKELMSIVLENTIDNALRFCNSAQEKEHFIEINVQPALNGRVSVSIVDNRDLDVEQGTPRLFDILQGSELETGEPEKVQHDLYFVKTAAKKIGGKVDVKKTPEGYNELTLVF